MAPNSGSSGSGLAHDFSYRVPASPREVSLHQGLRICCRLRNVEKGVPLTCCLMSYHGWIVIIKIKLRVCKGIPMIIHFHTKACEPKCWDTWERNAVSRIWPEPGDGEG